MKSLLFCLLTCTLSTHAHVDTDSYADTELLLPMQEGQSQAGLEHMCLISFPFVQQLYFGVPLALTEHMVVCICVNQT